MASPSIPSRHGLQAAVAVALLLLLAGCKDHQPTAAVRPRDPSLVIRQYDDACEPEVIVEETDSTETILLTFEGGYSGCVPRLVPWGIDMADPMATDTPQGSAYWHISTVHGAPSAVAVALLTPPQNFIEFDPPVRPVEFE